MERMVIMSLSNLSLYFFVSFFVYNGPAVLLYFIVLFRFILFFVW